MQEPSDTVLYEKQFYGGQAHGSYWAEKGKRLIDEGFAELSGVDELCSILGVSSSYFRELFYFSYSTNPKTYLNLVRIKESIRLLTINIPRGKHLSLNTIAKLVGFRNYSTFRKSFRKVTGINPSLLFKKDQHHDFYLRI